MRTTPLVSNGLGALAAAAPAATAIVAAAAAATAQPGGTERIGLPHLPAPGGGNGGQRYNLMLARSGDGEGGMSSGVGGGVRAGRLVWRCGRRPRGADQPRGIRQPPRCCRESAATAAAAAATSAWRRCHGCRDVGAGRKGDQWSALLVARRGGVEGGVSSAGGGACAVGGSRSGMGDGRGRPTNPAATARGCSLPAVAAVGEVGDAPLAASLLEATLARIMRKRRARASGAAAVAANITWRRRRGRCDDGDSGKGNQRSALLVARRGDSESGRASCRERV